MRPSSLQTEQQIELAGLLPVTNDTIVKELEKNRKGLISTALRRGLSIDEAEDAVSNTVAWLIENRDKLYYGPNFQALIFNKLNYEILIELKRKEGTIRDSGNWLSDTVETELNKDTQINEFIKDLSNDVGPRVAYVWYYRNIQKYPYYKIAEGFGCSVQKIRGMLELAKESSLLGGKRRKRSTYALIGSIYRKRKKTERNMFERRGAPRKIKQWKETENPIQYRFSYDFKKNYPKIRKQREFIMQHGILVPVIYS